GIMGPYFGPPIRRESRLGTIRHHPFLGDFASDFLEVPRRFLLYRRRTQTASVHGSPLPVSNSRTPALVPSLVCPICGVRLAARSELMRPHSWTEGNLSI